MRKVILSLAVSLDGYIEGPNGEYDWCFNDQDYGLSEFMQRIDAVFMGRKTYLLTLTVKDGGRMPPMEEYIFSNTLDDVEKGTLVKGDLATEVNKIKNKAGKDIWLFGGAGLTTSLINQGLVDEVHLAVHPVILGAGKHLFQDINKRIHLQLFESKTYDTGLVVVKYNLG